MKAAARAAAAKRGERSPPRKARAAPRPRPELWRLRLYVAGRTERSEAALANLEALCREHLAGRYRIEVVDLLVKPQLARGDQIVAVPTLVRRLPPPVKKIIGSLSSSERVLVGLDLKSERGAR